MKKNTKIIFTIILIAFAASALACKSDLTAEAPAQITSVAIDRDTKTSKRKTSSNKKKKKTTTSVETEIEYSYTVNGKTYSGYSEKDGDVQRDFTVGGQAKVCYNPQNPEESDVFPNNYKCG